MSEYGKGMIVYKTVPNVRIELTDGCNRSCKFCGHTYLKTPKKFMQPEVFEDILYKCPKGLKSLHFTVNGEPTLNPNIHGMVSMAREHLPNTNIQIITNGDQYIKDPEGLFDLFVKGANLVILDLYSDAQKDHWFKVITKWIDWCTDSNIKVVNGYGRALTEYYNSDPGTHRVFAYYDETKSFGSGKDGHKRVLHSWCGSIPSEEWDSVGVAPMSKFPHQVPCTENLKFVNIGVDGQLLACCRDMGKVMDLGTIYDYKDLQEWWTSDKLNIIRLALKSGRRDLIPICFFCNEKSARFGLYPYPGPMFDAGFVKSSLANMTKMNPILFKNLDTYAKTYGTNFPIFNYWEDIEWN